MIWNFFIVTYMELAVEVCVCFNLNYYNPEYAATDFNRISFILNWVIGIGYAIFLLFSAWFLKAPGADQRLLDPTSLKRYSALYEEMKPSDSSLTYVLLFILRRSAFALLVTQASRQEPVFLFGVFYIMTMVCVVYLVNYKPFASHG
jgi:hypothetical protein